MREIPSGLIDSRFLKLFTMVNKSAELDHFSINTLLKRTCALGMKLNSIQINFILGIFNTLFFHQERYQKREGGNIKRIIIC